MLDFVLRFPVRMFRNVFALMKTSLGGNLGFMAYALRVVLGPMRDLAALSFHVPDLRTGGKGRSRSGLTAKKRTRENQR